MDNKKEYKIMNDEELRKMIGKASEIFIRLTEPKSEDTSEPPSVASQDATGSTRAGRSPQREEVKQKSISQKTAV